MSNEFDYTKPWDDPVNLKVANESDMKLGRMKLLSCPSMNHGKSGHTNYFYVLNVDDRWPHDFFWEANTRPKIVLVESQCREVYWTEPVDFLYKKPKTEDTRIGQGFLDQLRKTKPPHPREHGFLDQLQETKPQQSGGYHCVTSDCLSLNVPYSTMYYQDRLILTLFRRPTADDETTKKKLNTLIGKLRKALTDPRNKSEYRGLTELLFLGELGPEASQAGPEIRRIMAEGNEKMRRIAAHTLAKIEK